MKLRAARRRTQGFTLIELVISGALMALILTSAYLCLHAAFSAQREIDPRVVSGQSARVALALMAADLRAACPLSPEREFVGIDRMVGDVEADNLDFATHNYSPRRAGEGDYCQVSYYLERNPSSAQYTLWRRRNPTIALDPFSGGSREEIAQGLRKLKFEYYDGWDWYDTWGDPDGRGEEQTSWRERPNLIGLPEAVRITLWLDVDPQFARPEFSNSPPTGPPMVFQTVARLNLASRSAGGISSGASPSSPSPSSGPASPGGSRGGEY
jgi:prepilin-type N-terminal cleavage/methylation domain-containing protein